MKNIFRILGLVLLCCTLHGAKSTAATHASTKPSKTRITIIGTIHEYHRQNKNYPAEEVKRILVALKPQAILVEYPRTAMDQNGNKLELLNKDGTLKEIVLKRATNPEVAATNEAAIALGVKQIPIEWESRNEYWRKTKFHERQRQANASFEKWVERLKKKSPNSVDLSIAQLIQEADQCELDLSARMGPDVINSEGFDRFIRIRHSFKFDVLTKVLEKYPGY